jgi:hypothetical protein
MQSTVRVRQTVGRMKTKLGGQLLLLVPVFCLLLSAPCRAQEATPAAPPSPTTEEEEALPPGDWAVELLYSIITSPNAEAADDLSRAAMAAGPAIVPQLELALKDDRTAEFAAQALAFIGGEKAMFILWRLIPDPRDLDLRRFYYGALGEFDTPDATKTLLGVVNHADAEPDRTVTEAAILALTVRSDPQLIPPLREAEKKIQDVVIRLDLENAIAVIEERARFLATPEGKAAGGSVEQAVRTYFAPALIPPPGPKPSAKTATPAKPEVEVRIQHLTLSPDKTRALAQVIFEDAAAEAYYSIVLQKRYGNWTVASVWLGSEVEKPPPVPPTTTHKPQ